MDASGTTSGPLLARSFEVVVYRPARPQPQRPARRRQGSVHDDVDDLAGPDRRARRRQPAHVGGSLVREARSPCASPPSRPALLSTAVGSRAAAVRPARSPTADIRPELTELRARSLGAVAELLEAGDLEGGGSAVLRPGRRTAGRLGRAGAVARARCCWSQRPHLSRPVPRPRRARHRARRASRPSTIRRSSPTAIAVRRLFRRIAEWCRGDARRRGRADSRDGARPAGHSSRSPTSRASSCSRPAWPTDERHELVAQGAALELFAGPAATLRRQPAPRSASARIRAGGGRWCARVGAAPGRPGARRRDRHRHGGRRARAPLRLLGRRARPEPRDARRGEGEARRATGELQSAIELVRGEAESLPFARRRVRPPHLHLPAPLRRRSRRRRCASWPGREAGGRIASLEFMLPPNALARALWRLYTRRGHARPRPADLARLVRGRPLPRPEHQRSLRATAARPPAGALARGRDRAACGRA